MESAHVVSNADNNKKYFTLDYPDSFALDYNTYYQDINYNSVRRCKLILFGQCIGKNPEIDTKLISNDESKYKKLYTNKILDSLNIGDELTQNINNYLYKKLYTKEHIVKNLERGCLNRAINKSRIHNIRCVWSEPKFVDLYHNICYKLASNIDTNSCINSDYIKNKILNNEVDLQNVANMQSKELCPKKYEKIDKKINDRNNLERKIKFSELYRCRKCKRNQCTTERRYARSADEGTDLTIHCLFCGHSWLS